jgi:hypothetical protein
MDDDRFNMSMRKFLKQVGVTSQQEIERVAREHNLNHTIEGEIDLPPK